MFLLVLCLNLNVLALNAWNENSSYQRITAYECESVRMWVSFDFLEQFVFNDIHFLHTSIVCHAIIGHYRDSVQISSSGQSHSTNNASRLILVETSCPVWSVRITCIVASYLNCTY